MIDSLLMVAIVCFGLLLLDTLDTKTKLHELQVSCQQKEAGYGTK